MTAETPSNSDALREAVAQALDRASLDYIRSLSIEVHKWDVPSEILADAALTILRPIITAAEAERDAARATLAAARTMLDATGAALADATKRNSVIDDRLAHAILREAATAGKYAKLAAKLQDKLWAAEAERDAAIAAQTALEPKP